MVRKCSLILFNYIFKRRKMMTFFFIYGAVLVLVCIMFALLILSIKKYYNFDTIDYLLKRPDFIRISDKGRILISGIIIILLLMMVYATNMLQFYINGNVSTFLGDKYYLLSGVDFISTKIFTAITNDGWKYIFKLMWLPLNIISESDLFIYVILNTPYPIIFFMFITLAFDLFILLNILFISIYSLEIFTKFELSTKNMQCLNIISLIAIISLPIFMYNIIAYILTIMILYFILRKYLRSMRIYV